MTVRERFLLNGFLCLTAMCCVFFYQWPAFMNVHIIQHDMPLHLSWMVKFASPEVFSRDVIITYAEYLSPLGFKTFYYFLIKCFGYSPWLGKILSVLLFILFVSYLFRIGEYFCGCFPGFIMAFYFMIWPRAMDTFAGGNPSAFAYPLLAAYFYYLLKKDVFKSCIVLILQLLFYPIAFPISLITTVIFFIFSLRDKTFFSKKDIFWIIVFPLGIALLLLCFKSLTKPPFIGDLVNAVDMYSNFEFLDGNRCDYLPFDSPIELIKGNLLSHRMFLLFLPVFIIAWITYYRKNDPRLKLCSLCLALFISGLILYCLAHVFLFNLHKPQRYLSYNLTLVNVFSLSLAAGFLLDLLRKTALKIAFTVLVALMALFLYENILKPVKCKLVADLETVELLEYIKVHLPEEAIYAADPFLSDNILMFSERRVFMNDQFAQPWFKGWYKDFVVPRTIAFFDAYYSETGNDVLAFCRKNNIGFFVIDKRAFSAEYLHRGMFYFYPLNEKVRDLVRQRKDFFFLRLKASHETVFCTRVGNYCIVRMEGK